MMGETKHEARAVFTAALALSTPDERARYLDGACQGKPELRQRVEALLRAHEQAARFLEVNGRDQDALREGPGTVIGRYKLLEEIGEGAFGRVFMAEQTEPVRRKVALKIIKAGMDTREVIARFEAERQALALMDHPNIAKVLDAGATETGRPYFVMELVQGIPITAYCEQQQLPTTGRLRLFMKVCAAVQHAHQKGIIHRDLKPTNILITVIDGEAVPKVIDFGVAKALGQKLTEKTLFTGFQQMVGTPAYMSPEQASLSGVDVDTRSDIYSLGVLLYELLTGVTPFDQETFRKAALDEICRLIRETEPPKPSTRLVKNPKSEIQNPKFEEVRGELDWIVMKCLEKDRARRYETANALARDVEHHLDQEPVSAAAPSVIYRFRKFVRRNRLAVATSAAVFLALALGIGTTTWMHLRRQEALQEQTRLRLEAEKARAAEANAREAEASARAAETNARMAEASAHVAETSARTNLQVRLDIARAKSLIVEKKFSEAEELLNGIEPAYLAGDAIVEECRRALAWQSIVKSDQNGSVDRMALLIRDDGSAWNFEVASDYGNYSSILVQNGRIAEYENFRRLLLTRFSPDPNGSDYFCLLALKTPADEGILKAVTGHYNMMQERERFSDENTRDGGGALRFRLGLTEYRLGHFERAARLCDMALSRPVDFPLYLPARIAVNAMAHYQLKEYDEARLALTICHRRVDPVMKKGPTNFGLNTMGGWLNWVEGANFQREADELMGAPTAEDHNRVVQVWANLNEAEKFGTNPDFYSAPRTEHDRAQQLAAETPAILQRLDGKKFVSLLRALGFWELQNHQRREAVTNWSLVVYGPSSRGSLLYGQDLSGFYLSLAPLLVELNDREGFERFRANAIETFGKTAIPANAARTLETCLLRPADGTQMSALARLATMLTATPVPTNGLPTGDLTLALFKYRSGDPSGALESVRTNLSLAVTTPALSARSGVLRAMCLARLGRLNEAQTEIDAVRATIDNKYNSPPISQPADSESWHDWWVDHILLQEARALLQK